MKNYIFSYGSLINKDSLAKTIGDNSKNAKAAIIKGYERGWRNNVHHEQRTGLGIIEKENAQVNGVIFEVDEQYLKNLDEREYGFERKKIENQDKVDGTLWAYFVIKPKTPTEELPIALSYVETVIAGCLTQSEEFAKEFIKDTVNWEFPFVNDRNNPRFPRRAELTEEKQQKIDQLLQELLPEIVKKLGCNNTLFSLK